jgi:CheY-like chemotaxis protein
MNQESSSQSPTILVVDDDEDFLNSIDFTLRSSGINNVDCCQDSRYVMHLLEKKKYSLILLDLKMSPISGLELLPQIVERYPEIPVIVLTGRKEIETAVECMRYGAVDYLVKGFDISRLLKAVQGSLDFIGLENADDVLKEFDFSNENDTTDHSKALLKIDFLLRTGKAQLFIAKVAPIIENKQINRGNVGLFYALGKAYEKIENFGKAADVYRDIAKFNPIYPEIQEKLERIEKLKKDIIKVYHK